MSDVELYISEEVLSEYGAGVLAQFEQFLLTHNIDIEQKSHPVIVLYESLIDEKNNIYQKEFHNLEAVREIRGKFKFAESFIERMNQFERAV